MAVDGKKNDAWFKSYAHDYQDENSQKSLPSQEVNTSHTRTKKNWNLTWVFRYTLSCLTNSDFLWTNFLEIFS